MWAKKGIDDQMGSALEQINATHLRIGGRTMLAARPTKGQRIGKGVGHVLYRAVDSHQPQAEEKGARRLFGGTWAADPFEQAAQGQHAQLLTSLAQRTGPRQLHAGIGPDVAQSAGDLLQDVSDRQAGQQAHGNDDDDDAHHVEGTFPLFPALGLAEDLADEGKRDDLLKDVQIQQMRELALRGNLA